MHPLRTFTTLVFGLYGCVAIPFGVALISNKGSCDQQRYIIANTNVTMVWPPECQQNSYYNIGLALTITGSISLVVGCIGCACCSFART